MLRHSPSPRRWLGCVIAVLAVVSLATACSSGDGGDRVNAGSSGAGSSSGGAASNNASNDFIRVESPSSGDAISSPVTISGQNRTFENTVRIRVLGADGSTLADVFTTGNGRAPGEWGDFAAPVAFAKGTNTHGTIVVFEESSEDGSEIHVLKVPVKFA